MGNNTEQDKKISPSLSHKNIDPISFFEKDSNFVFICKKTEKLAIAIYMVTNLFSDNEPMKWTLRKKASDLMSFIVGYKDVLSLEQEDFAYKVKTKILELVSLLLVSSQGGLMTEMNFSILKQEFLNLIITIDSSRVTVKEPIMETMSKTFFDVQKTDLSMPNHPDYAHSNLTGMSYTIQRTDSNFIKDKDTFKRSSRQNIILSLLKKKKELTTKDISQVIKDCSEKTIQRELISFISAGVLKKTGQRRWSKYSLS